MASLSRALPAEAIDFVPAAATLETIIAGLAEHDGDAGTVNDAALRRDAFARYQSLEIPGGRPGRAWRYDYAKLPFENLEWNTGRLPLPTRPIAPPSDEEAAADRTALATENVGGIVHAGSIVLESQRPSTLDPRIIVVPLADARRDHAALLAGVQHRVAQWRDDKFAALSTAFQNCGAFVYVPDGVSLDAPIQLLFVNDESSTAAIFPHIVVILGRGARATVIERVTGDGDVFVSSIVEAHVGEDAQLDYVTVQQADIRSRVFATRASRSERNGTARWLAAELGGGLVRSVIDAQLSSPGARGETAALFFTGGMQHVELTTQSVHAVEQTTSATVVRSAATDHGQGRFFGNIAIHKSAHGADATLRDDVLLLSKGAHIDSVPALEIAANDVKAFHGATVGSLSEEQLFYARSRGIARADAIRMIALGFFENVIARFPGEILRDEIRTALDQKIDDATEID